MKIENVEVPFEPANIGPYICLNGPDDVEIHKNNTHTCSLCGWEIDVDSTEELHKRIKAHLEFAHPNWRD